MKLKTVLFALTFIGHAHLASANNPTFDVRAAIVSCERPTDTASPQALAVLQAKAESRCQELGLSGDVILNSKITGRLSAGWGTGECSPIYTLNVYGNYSCL